jgi:hypothetical protein
MAHWKRAVLLGLLSWLIPFAISFAAFPLKKSNARLSVAYGIVESIPIHEFRDFPHNKSACRLT